MGVSGGSKTPHPCRGSRHADKLLRINTCKVSLQCGRGRSVQLPHTVGPPPVRPVDGEEPINPCNKAERKGLEVAFAGGGKDGPPLAVQAGADVTG